MLDLRKSCVPSKLRTYVKESSVWDMSGKLLVAFGFNGQTSIYYNFKVNKLSDLIWTNMKLIQNYGNFSQVSYVCKPLSSVFFFTWDSMEPTLTREGSFFWNISFLEKTVLAFGHLQVLHKSHQSLPKGNKLNTNQLNYMYRNCQKNSENLFRRKIYFI